MPALMPTDHTATITYLGTVADRDSSLRSAKQTSMELTFAGPKGEAHAGLTRPACSRVRMQHKKGTPIRNVRQLSIVSVEELAAIAQAIGLDALDPKWLGATMVVEGIADFTHIPPSSRLQADNGCCLTVDMENQPCRFPGEEIDKDLPGGKGKRFAKAAEGMRGVTAWVEREGVLSVGDRLRLHVPAQRAWAGL